MHRHFTAKHTFSSHEERIKAKVINAEIDPALTGHFPLPVTAGVVVY